MPEVLVLAELLTLPGARECRATHRPSKVGKSAVAVQKSRGASKMRTFSLLLDVGTQGLSPWMRRAEADMGGQRQIWTGSLLTHEGPEAFLKCWKCSSPRC